MGVGGLKASDVGVHEVEFAFDEAAECIVEIGALGTEPFDLGALQDDSCFVFLQYLIVVMGFFVAGDEIDGQKGSFFGRIIPKG